MTTSNSLEIVSLKKFEDLMFGQRIGYIIESRGLSKSWIAERLGISKQALNYLLKHANKPKFVDELAEMLELNPEWLEKGVGSPSANRKIAAPPQKSHVLLLSKFELLTKPKSSWKGQDTIDFSGDQAKNLIAYKLEDNSNFPPFIQESILIFDTKKQPRSEDYVLSIIEDDVFVRQYLVDGDNTCYKASNNEHKTFINPKGKLLGVLVEARYQIS